MHLNEISKLRLLKYFTNLGQKFKESVFNDFIEKNLNMPVSKLRFNYVSDIRAAIATNDTSFVLTLINRVNLEDNKTKSNKRIKYINRNILKSSNLFYEDAFIICMMNGFSLRKTSSLIDIGSV
jgi:hypothetical protein